MIKIIIIIKNNHKNINNNNIKSNNNKNVDIKNIINNNNNKIP